MQLVFNFKAIASVGPENASVEDRRSRISLSSDVRYVAATGMQSVGTRQIQDSTMSALLVINLRKTLDQTGWTSVSEARMGSRFDLIRLGESANRYLGIRNSFFPM